MSYFNETSILDRDRNKSILDGKLFNIFISSPKFSLSVMRNWKCQLVDFFSHPIDSVIGG